MIIIIIITTMYAYYLILIYKYKCDVTQKQNISILRNSEIVTFSIEQHLTIWDNDKKILHYLKKKYNQSKGFWTPFLSTRTKTLVKANPHTDYIML